MYDDIGQYRTVVLYEQWRMSGNVGANTVIGSDAPFSRPPISEVNLTIWFDPIRTLASLHLSSLRTAWSAEFPKVEEKAPLAPWNLADAITFVDDKWPMPACIFAATEREKQILIQSDRFGLTWYFTSQNQYPGFKALSEDFNRRYRQFEAALQDSGNEEPELVRVTIEYENYLDLFDSNLVARRVVAGEQILNSDRGVITGGTTAVRKNVHPSAENDLNVTLLVGVDSTGRGGGVSYASPEDVDPGVTQSAEDDSEGRATLLTISGRAKIDKGDDAFECMRRAHDASHALFLEIFDDSLKSSWGKK